MDKDYHEKGYEKYSLFRYRVKNKHKYIFFKINCRTHHLIKLSKNLINKFEKGFDKLFRNGLKMKINENNFIFSCLWVARATGVLLTIKEADEPPTLHYKNFKNKFNRTFG